MKILITGAEGFIGRNLHTRLMHMSDWTIYAIDRANSRAEFEDALANAEFVVHLAGVNRPLTEEEFQRGNVDLTTQICGYLQQLGRSVPLLLASSIQAELDNPYGISKRNAELVVTRYAEQVGAPVLIYRLMNVFGKWCRPNYNSVVATFCHNIARDLPITISDPQRILDLVYIDDVLLAFISDLQELHEPGVTYRSIEPSYQTTLGELAETLRTFRSMRTTLQVPSTYEPFVRKLYATYLSYLPNDQFAYSLDKRCDPRGCLAEFLKDAKLGQIFVSRTLPGITRGNHFHHTKAEKFLVLEGNAVIRFRHLVTSEILEYFVCGHDFRVVDIPPGYTHSIQNIGEGELVTLFWSSEVFDPLQPDTYAQPVLPPSE